MYTRKTNVEVPPCMQKSCPCRRDFSNNYVNLLMSHLCFDITVLASSPLCCVCYIVYFLFVLSVCPKALYFAYKCIELIPIMDSVCYIFWGASII